METAPNQKRKQQELLSDELAKFKERCADMERLVQLRGYKYAKAIGMDICDKYKCAPPENEAERQKWETYNTLLWSMSKLFGEIESLAKQAPERT